MSYKLVQLAAFMLILGFVGFGAASAVAGEIASDNHEKTSLVEAGCGYMQDSNGRVVAILTSSVCDYDIKPLPAPTEAEIELALSEGKSPYADTMPRGLLRRIIDNGGC